MTLDKLIKKLKAIRRRKKIGHWPVQYLFVNGLTTAAFDIRVEVAKKYDGERIWIYETNKCITAVM